MPVINKNDRGNWYNSIPVEGADRRFRPDPDTFDINKLQENEIDYGNGTVMAKIPVIPGHIYKRSSENRINTYIELVLGRTFDKEKNQGRNKKVIIGTDASGLFPGMMVINDHYREYFDRNGRIIHEELKRTLAEEARQKKEKKQKREAAKREKQKQAMEQKIAERPYGIDYASLTDREWTALGDVLEEALTQDETAVSETAKTETEEGKSGTVRDDLTETEDYLQLAEEPVADRDGEIIAGTTYGEMSMLMSAYHWTLAAHSMNMLNEKFDMPGRKKTDVETNTTEEKEENP